MKLTILRRRTKHLSLLATLLVSGCATTMQMSHEELKKIQPNEGIVIGTVLIKGGKDILGRNSWALVAKSIKDTSLMSSLVSSGFEYTIQASRDGEEEVFVTRIPAGDYHFWKLFQPGFSSATAKTNVQFRVQPGKTTYIGRLVVEFPPGFITASTRFLLRVENAKASALDSASRKFGLSGDEAITDLMTIREPN